MKLEDHEKLITKALASHSDIAILTETLQTLRDDYSKEYNSKEELTKTKADLETQITKLKENNMALFLKIGNPVPEKKEEQTSDPESVLDDIVKGWVLL